MDFMSFVPAILGMLGGSGGGEDDGGGLGGIAKKPKEDVTGGVKGAGTTLRGYIDFANPDNTYELNLYDKILTGGRNQIAPAPQQKTSSIDIDALKELLKSGKGGFDDYTGDVAAPKARAKRAPSIEDATESLGV